MHPVLFRLGSLTIYTYGALVAAGVLLGLWVARKQAARVGLAPEKVWNLGIYLVLSALVMAKLWLVVAYADYYREHPREIFSLSILQSGGTFYGGLLGAIVLLLAFVYFQKIPLGPLLDTYALGLPIGHALGRVGCFFAGCCYGKPTSLPWGVTFRSPVANQIVGTPLGIPLHPTQLYEASLEILNFVLLFWLSRRQRFTGQLAATYLVLYGVERGLLEFLRNDPDRTLLFHDAFSLMQIVSVFLILGGATVLWRGFQKRAAESASSAARS